ncbi:hypothetical protein CHISP_0684 [Chitinispirillum alkaliphilum]|nr:hypothetical protein CHISP_0684 [Chitinispirillum alkaliphilum]
MAHSKMNKKRYLVLSCIIGLVSSFSIISGEKTDSQAQLTDKQIIDLVLNLTSVELDTLRFCNNVGTDPEDSTVGQYLAGFWEMHTNRIGTNFLRVEKEPMTGKQAEELFDNDSGTERKAMEGLSGDEQLWLVDFYVCRENGEEQWCWGIRFLVRQADKSVVREAVWCIGAG